MLRLQAVRLGFLLGISLILSAMIYFFAANWSGIDRLGKISLAAGLVILFYGVSFVLSRMKGLFGHQHFLSNIVLVGGCISFGTAVALLDQIYNAHANSYVLFLVWSIPALLLAWITRYPAFYVLSYVLVHLALWFYFIPSSVFMAYEEPYMLMYGFIFLLVNLVLFILTESNRLRSPALRMLSFIVLHITLWFLSNSFYYETYGVYLNVLWVGILAAGFYYFLHVRFNTTFVALNALAVSGFAVFKFIELTVYHSSTLFFLYGLIFVVALLTGNVLFFRYLRRLEQTRNAGSGVDEADVNGGSAAQADRGEPKPTSTDSAHDRRSIMSVLVSRIIKIVGILIGSISLIGLALITTGLSHPEYGLLTLSLIFMVSMTIWRSVDSVIRYTTLCIGFIIGVIAALWIDNLAVSVIVTVLIGLGWLSSEGRTQLWATHAIWNLSLGMMLYQLLDDAPHSFTYMMMILALINGGLLAAHSRLTALSLQENSRKYLGESSLFLTLLFLLWLTFLQSVIPYSHVIFNILNFVVVTYLAFRYLHQHRILHATISVVFWFLFIGFQYYDLLWPLLHKSLTLALLGILALVLAYMAARRTAGSSKKADPIPHNSLIHRRTIAIVLVILLQLAYIGSVTAYKESLLQSGATVKLELVPVDPRSLLQGDYVQLGYTISNPPSPAQEKLIAMPYRARVGVVLAPDAGGIYTFQRLYQTGETLRTGELVLNGRVSGGGGVYYGIESYFVPEGTGLDIQMNARYAHIRISAAGDAILESVGQD